MNKLIGDKIVSSYGFNEKLQEGIHGENKMDLFFKKYFEIINVNVEVQKILHYDRIFKPISDKKIKYKVEYKNDIKALKTGNFFVETHSKLNSIPGWIYKSQADWFSILIGEKIYLVDKFVLQYYINTNKDILKERTTKPTTIGNYKYKSAGYLLPIKQLETISNIYHL